MRPTTPQLEIVLATIPLMGHLTPLLPYAEELLRRGHSVTFVHDGSNPKYRQKIEASGLAACRSITYNSGQQQLPMYESILEHYNGSSSNGVAPTRKRPAAIVYDFFAYDAADAADALGVPAIGVFPNLAVTVNPWAASLSQQKQSILWKIWCSTFVPCMEMVLSTVLWTARSVTRWRRQLPLLRGGHDLYPSRRLPTTRRPMIGCTSPELEYNAASRLGPDVFAMVGPGLPTVTEPLTDDLDAWLSLQERQGKTVVYVAFGTMFRYNRKIVQSIQSDLLGFGATIAVVWSLPAKAQRKFLDHATLPSRDHWRVESFVPQVSLFRTGKVHTFVSHCGSNSVYEALLTGVPIVCCPGFADQPGNAVRLVRAGVATIAQRKRGAFLQVGDALDELLRDRNRFQHNVRLLSERLGLAGGAQQAASVIERVVANRQQCSSNNI